MTRFCDPLPDYSSRTTLILGCGNILRGDDGFGPEVITYLKDHFHLAEDVALVDAGTGVNEVLLDVALSEPKPRRIVIVDAMENGLPAGTVSSFSLDQICPKEIRAFSAHQVPTSSLLRELKELCNVDITVVTAQPGNIPQEVQLGLSPAVRKSLPEACRLIATELLGSSTSGDKSAV